MATKKDDNVETATLTITQKLLAARRDFLNAGVKKSGKNIHAEFLYYELKDIVPTATEIFTRYNLLYLNTFVDGMATGTLVDLDSDKTLVFQFPMRSIAEPAKFRMNEVQGLGAEITYFRRYLYMLLFDIVDADGFDGVSGGNTEPPAPEPPKPKKPATTEERKEIKKNLTKVDAPADELQVNALKGVIKELLQTDPSKEEFVQKIVLKTEKFTKLTKVQCEELIMKIQGMIKILKEKGAE